MKCFQFTSGFNTSNLKLKPGKSLKYQYSQLLLSMMTKKIIFMTSEIFQVRKNNISRLASVDVLVQKSSDILTSIPELALILQFLFLFFQFHLALNPTPFNTKHDVREIASIKFFCPPFSSKYSKKNTFRGHRRHHQHQRTKEEMKFSFLVRHFVKDFQFTFHIDALQNQ